MPVRGPDETEPPEGVSKNATMSRSLDVGGMVAVEAARVEVLGLIRMFATVFVCKHPRNRKRGEALDKAFLATLASINHPYVSCERVILVECQQERRRQGPIPVDSIQSPARSRTCT